MLNCLDSDMTGAAGKLEYRKDYTQLIVLEILHIALLLLDKSVC